MVVRSSGRDTGGAVGGQAEYYELILQAAEAGVDIAQHLERIQDAEFILGSPRVDDFGRS
jgi:hypothetical protein